jgi:hypothetical protein
MFSKQEATQLRKEFWTVFGQYMSPITSSEGERVNWINYKTGLKGLQFKMDAGQTTASIGIILTQPDIIQQQLIFEQLKQSKIILHKALQEEWTWLLHTRDEQQKIVSKIYTEKAGVSIFRKEDWPELISFFKPRMIALDEAWNKIKYGFAEWQ